MPYNSLEEFRRAVIDATDAYPADGTLGHYNAAAVTDNAIENAYKVYQAARNTNLNMLIMGRWVAASNEAQPGIDQLTQSNFHIMDEVFTGGSVMNSGNWTMLMNDAWVLGGIHSHTPFYLASRRTEANIRNANYGITVTGRELIGVTTFGYNFVQGHEALGEVAQCANRGLADGATLRGYLQAVTGALELDHGQPHLRNASLPALIAPAGPA